MNNDNNGTPQLYRNDVTVEHSTDDRSISNQACMVSDDRSGNSIYNEQQESNGSLFAK
jgi:hypothetical protein